jgi:hypothetical protein
MPALFVLVAASWGEFLLRIVVPALEAHWRRPAFWVAARLALEGRGEVIYGDAVGFVRESERLGAVPDVITANAPTALLPILPLGLLPIDTAKVIWIVFSVACAVAALMVLMRALLLPLPWALAVAALVPPFQPLRYNTYVGHVYTLALLAFVLGAVLASRAESDRSVLKKIGAGAGYAIGTVVRHFYGAALLVTPLVRRQWGVVAAAVGLYGVAALGTLLWLGPGAWGASLGYSLEWRDKPETALTAYQSLNNFLTHLFRYHPTLNPGPVVDAPWVVGPLWWGLALVILGVSVWAIWRYRVGAGTTPAERLLPYAFAVPVAILLAPISEDYHHTLALFPLILMGVVLAQSWGVERGAWYVAAWLALGLAVVLLGAPWRYYNVPVPEGWAALWYYPRFYGEMVLWGLGLGLLRTCSICKLRLAHTTKDFADRNCTL